MTSLEPPILGVAPDTSCRPHDPATGWRERWTSPTGGLVPVGEGRAGPPAPGGFDAIVETVVPVPQNRGLFRQTYRHPSLRAHLRHAARGRELADRGAT